MSSTNKRIILYITTVIISIILLCNHSLFIGTGRSLLFKCVYILLWAMALFTAIILHFYGNKLSGWKPGKWYPSCVLTLLVPIFFFILEFAFHTDFYKIQSQYLWINLILTVCIVLILFFLFNSLRATVIVGSVFYFVWGIANYFVNTFRGQPVQIADLKATGTAMQVVSQYSFYFTPAIVCLAVFCLSMITICLWLPDFHLFHSKKSRILSRIYATVIIGGLAFWISSSSYLNEASVDFWNMNAYYRSHGTQLSTSILARKMVMDEPDSYSVQAVETILNAVEEPERFSSNTPDIIAIMNETFTDFSFMADFTTNLPYIDYYNSLSENCIKGKIYVSCYGAGTSRTEYEFLTGNSMAYFDTLITPYSTCFQKKQYSLVSTLASQGYETYALHPGDKNNWNRHSVYSSMGFDHFESKSDFSGCETIRNGWISDMACYERIIDILENNDSDNPQFIFNVTIQNHGGYTDENFVSDVTINGNSYETANQYISLISKSDDALEYLMEYLKKREKPTMVIFFGDHWPNLETEFYNWLNGKSDSELDIWTYQQYYMTPFFIWTNYDIPEQDDIITSANYLSSMALQYTGLEMTSYNKYLLQLQDEIPALGIYGYFDSDYTYYSSFEENTTNGEHFNEYRILQYNNLFDKNRLTSGFSLSSE